MKFLILILLILTLLTNSEDNLTLDSLLSWSNKNNIKISPKVKISFEKEDIKITALEDISNNEEIVTMPYNMLINIDNTLELLNSPEIKSQWEKFQKIEIENYKDINEDIHKEEIFLSYILYLMKHEKEKYQNTEFYKKFYELFLCVETYKPKAALFYTNEQKEFLSGTYMGLYLNDIKKRINKEIDIFKGLDYYNKSIDMNDYTQKRLFVHNRGMDTSQRAVGEMIIAPIFTLFNYSSLQSNARLEVQYLQNAKIITSYKIKAGNEIIVFIVSKTNAEKMVLEGRMNSYYTDYHEPYLIPVYSPQLYYKYDIDDISLLDSHHFNLFSNKFEFNSMNYYRENYKIFNGIDSNSWACDVLVENVGYYKDYVENLMKRVDELFNDDGEKKNNVEKALKGEMMNLNAKYKRVSQICAYEKKKENENNQRNTDL